MSRLLARRGIQHEVGDDADCIPVGERLREVATATAGSRFDAARHDNRRQNRGTEARDSPRLPATPGVEDALFLLRGLLRVRPPSVPLPIFGLFHTETVLDA